eukprot:10668156-Alexandrium_andersonii.AAC.1
MAHDLAAPELPVDRLLAVRLRGPLSGAVPVEKRASDPVGHLLEIGEIRPRGPDHPNCLVRMKGPDEEARRLAH